MSKPSILIVPGSFALPEFYDEVVTPMAAKGYAIKAIHLPSVGLKTGPREGEPPTMYDDAAFIAKEVTKLADEGKDVVLIAHSYGGAPTTESTKGLGKAERQKAGKKGGIVRLAYLTALVPDVGQPAGAILAEVRKENRTDPIEKDGWLYFPDLERAASLCFSDIPKEEGLVLMKKFPQHSAVSFAGPLTHAGYKDIPVSYLFCEEDLIIPPAYQRAGIDLVERESGNKVDVTYVKSGHIPNNTKPQEVINWFVHLAEISAGK